MTAQIDPKKKQLKKPISVSQHDEESNYFCGGCKSSTVIMWMMKMDFGSVVISAIHGIVVNVKA